MFAAIPHDKNISSLTQQWGISCFRFLIRKKNRISIISQIFGLGWKGAKLQLQKVKILICSRTYVVWSEYSRFTHTVFKSKEIKKWKPLDLLSLWHVKANYRAYFTHITKLPCTSHYIIMLWKLVKQKFLALAQAPNTWLVNDICKEALVHR